MVREQMPLRASQNLKAEWLADYIRKFRAFEQSVKRVCSNEATIQWREAKSRLHGVLA